MRLALGWNDVIAECRPSSHQLWGTAGAAAALVGAARAVRLIDVRGLRVSNTINELGIILTCTVKCRTLMLKERLHDAHDGHSSAPFSTR